MAEAQIVSRVNVIQQRVDGHLNALHCLFILYQITVRYYGLR